jgi:hypothetical protein
MLINDFKKFKNSLSDIKILKTNLQFTKKEINELDNIYNNFYLKKKNIKSKIEEHLDLSNGINDLNYLINNFNYPKKIKNKINSLKKIYKINYNFNNTIVNITIYHNKLNKKLVNELIDLINFNIILFDNLDNKKQNLNIYIFNINLNKKILINKKNELINENINSGYTQKYPNSNRDYIVLYRTEELKKVLIHELIHLYKFHSLSNLNSLKIYDLIKNTNNSFSIYEAYTETFATLIYTFYFLKNSNKYNDLHNDYNELIKDQLLFSFLQASKVFYNQKILNINNMKIINENTNAISYYILKCVILNNLNLFKKMFNKKEGLLLNFPKRIIRFDELLVKSYNNNFKKKINFFLLILKNKELQSKNLLTTFRMNILY